MGNYTIGENIKNMSNYELGEIAKAFMNCENYKWCLDCPCDGVLCSRVDNDAVRRFFQYEVIHRLMENK